MLSKTVVGNLCVSCSEKDRNNSPTVVIDNSPQKSFVTIFITIKTKEHIKEIAQILLTFADSLPKE